MLSAACLITGPVAVEEAVSVVKSRYNEGTDQAFSSMLCQAIFYCSNSMYMLHLGFHIQRTVKHNSQVASDGCCFENAVTDDIISQVVLAS